MKCIKCHKKEATIHLYCESCEEKRLYQQRLDKVLEKFNLINDGKSYEITDDAIVFDIDYITKENKFYMVYGCYTKIARCDKPELVEWVEYMKPISLDTVEHLIADMEAQNEAT